MRNPLELERILERTKKVLTLAAEPRCYMCHGVGDRCVYGRRGSPYAIYDCKKCREERGIT